MIGWPDACNMKKQRIRRILVPIDFSVMSRSALATAKQLARRFEAAIDLVHVHRFNYPAGFAAPAPPLMPHAIITYDREAKEKAVEDLSALAAQHDLPREACHVVGGGPAFNEICRLARELPADLIVLPTHGYSGLKHVFLGSTAERVVQHSPCPVFVVRERGGKTSRISSNEKSSSGIDNILVPVDFSECSFQALEYAIEFAERFAAGLTIFHAVDFGYALTADGYGMYDLSALQESARKNAEGEMEKFVQLAKFRRVKFETIVKVGSPVSEICEFADQRNVDLIVTATHGRTGFKHLLIGSVAEHIVRHAQRPVLVVPSHPKVRTARLAEGAQRFRKLAGSRAGKAALPKSRERLTKRNRKLLRHQLPERRKTNKFRETHSGH